MRHKYPERLVLRFVHFQGRHVHAGSFGTHFDATAISTSMCPHTPPTSCAFFPRNEEDLEPPNVP